MPRHHGSAVSPMSPQLIPMNSSHELRVLQIAAAILAAGLALAFPVFSAHQEAAAYNRITNGPHVTTWEALFLELRVEACNSKR